MKSFGEYFSSLLNMNMFCKDESNVSTDSLDKSKDEKEEVQETKSEISEDSKNNDKKENQEIQKENETFEFIEVSENTLDEDVEDMFITKF